MAVEAVIRDIGPAGLTVEAVAEKAGISKASVLYDFKTKKQLMSAYVTRQIAAMVTLRAQQAEQAAAAGQPMLCALLAESAVPPSEEDIAGAVQLTASLGADDCCRAQMSAYFEAEIARVRDEAAEPHQALLAWLALHGLKSMEYLGFHQFDDATRHEILDDIRALIGAPSEPTPTLTPTPGDSDPSG